MEQNKYLKIKDQPTDKLQELLRQLRQDKENKIDYIADANQLSATYDVGTKTYKLNLLPSTMESLNPTDTKAFEITDICHQQIAVKTQIPKIFYDRLREKYPELLLQNINELIHDKDNKIMVRTLYGRARALLSNRYQPIDNYDVMACALKNFDLIQKRDNININIMRADVTDSHFYLKVYSPDFSAIIGKTETNTGDKVHGGIIISNSEVGQGRFSVKLFIAVIQCNNGMISEKGLSRVHIGSSKEDQTIEWSERTIELDDATLFSKLEDLIHTGFQREKFNTWIDELNEKASTPITKPIVAIKNVVRDYGIPKEETDQLLLKFSQYGYTQWGLTQTVTDHAQSQKSYNKQIELEKAGADIMTRKVEVLIKEEE